MDVTRSIRFLPAPHFSSVMPTHEAIRDCPFTNPRLPLERLTAAMVARVLHPGHDGPLTVSLPGDATLRRHNSPWESDRSRSHRPGVHLE